MAKTMLGPEARRELTAHLVRSLYGSFDVATLEEILAVGRKYEAEMGAAAPDEVLLMNEALAAEIERRKAAR